MNSPADLNLLAGVTHLTVVNVRHGAGDLIRSAAKGNGGKWSGGLTVPRSGRLLISTPPVFETDEAAKAHMERVVQACIRYEFPK